MRRNTFIRRFGSFRDGTYGVTRSRAHGGFTLLEVLTSIFVLTFGLLGITAMMQIGGYRVWQATRRDKASFISEQAFADLQVRETVPLLDDYCGEAVPAAVQKEYENLQKTFNYRSPFLNRCLVVYDPEAATRGNNLWFASQLEWDLGISYFASPSALLTTLPDGRNVVVWQEPKLNAGRFFDPIRTRPTQCRDDLVWDTDNRERRPIAEWWSSDGSMIPKIDASGNTNGDLQTQAYEGNWSWLATIQPIGGCGYDENGNVVWDTNTYEISVAIYEMRSFRNEVGFTVVKQDSSPTILDSMFRRQFDLKRITTYGDMEESRTLLQPGHWVALVGTPMDSCDKYGILRSGQEIPPFEQRVVWMRVVNSRSTANGYNVQLTGPELARTSTVHGQNNTMSSETLPLLISPNYPVSLITDPEIVGVVTRTVMVAE